MKDASPQPIASITIQGKTVLEETNEPVAGIAIAWSFQTSSELYKHQKPIIIAEGRSNQAGEFSLSFHPQEGQEEISRLIHCGSSWKSYITVLDNMFENEPYLLNLQQEYLSIPLKIVSEKESKMEQELPALAEFMMVNRLWSIQDFRKQLLSPWEDSPSYDWDMQDRMAILFQTDQMLLNKEKQTNNLQEIPINFNLIEIGKWRESFEGPTSIPDYEFIPLKRSNLQLYRDYLRGIWVKAARLMHKNLPFNGNSQVKKADLEAQLNNRLHQNFRYAFETESSKAELLGHVLSAALIVPKDLGGFGKTQDQLPPRQVNQTFEEYLDQLIALTKQSKKELSQRFRVSFEPKANEKSSVIKLNIEALIGFLADSYQSELDPFPANPQIHEKRPKPIIMANFLGKAPFFLHYNEWLDRRQPFYAENYFDIRRTSPYFEPSFRQLFATRFEKKDVNLSKTLDHFDEVEHPIIEQENGSGSKVVALFELTDKLNHALWQYDHGDYRGSSTTFYELEEIARTIQKFLIEKGWKKNQFAFQPRNYGMEYREISLAQRGKLVTDDLNGLKLLESFYSCPKFPPYEYGDTTNVMVREKSIYESCALFVHWLTYFKEVFVPVLRARISRKIGDYASSLNYLAFLSGTHVGIANQDTSVEYAANENSANFYPTKNLHHLNDLPYTTSVAYHYDTGKKEFQKLKPSTISDCEWKALRIEQGQIMLEWAELLQRNDDEASNARARELFKGVLILHGIDPAISPSYPQEGTFSLFIIGYFGNPAIMAQLSRAWYGLYLISEGLNVYGWSEDMVPLLRYSTLIDQAKSLTAFAKSTQNDFIAYTSQLEQAQLNRLQASNLLEKALATVQIADEQIAIQQHEVKLAQNQVKEVEKLIQKKRAELQDKESFFGQFKSYLSGLKDVAKSMGGDGKKNPVEGLASKIGAEKALATLGSGAMVLGGMALFAYASYVTMQGMETAFNSLGSELKALENQALPAAKAQVVIKQRFVKIAEFQKQIASSDYHYAKTISTFQQDRFLSAETWGKLALLAEQMMLYYVDAAGRMAWLAERALAFEQMREIHIIRKNYIPKSLRGISAADALQVDLSSLEMNRLMGLKLSLPFKQRISLSQHFPMAFANLKNTGSCSFFTDENYLKKRYPGLYACRIHSLSVDLPSFGNSKLTGTLRNRGLSIVQNLNDEAVLLIRFPDATLLSDFKMQQDMELFGLPGETLLSFEGSGFTSSWELNLSQVDENLNELADVYITFHGCGQYSDTLFSSTTIDPLQEQLRAINSLVSYLSVEDIANFRNGLSDELIFNFLKIKEDIAYTQRSISNIALVVLGESPGQATLKTSVGNSEITVLFDEEGIAASNNGVLAGNQLAEPLNELLNQALDQTFTLSFDSLAAKGIKDVMLYVEYKLS
ncbi:hypothetical protein ACFRAE_04895 [Sphingobacterium sp. HJSM2_6]|uniref:Tc toxin subunit A-related protein n=1 Tax=Sphingobacterium sp. HJSM2_6 TaxID=3366264 RepID=UPI003BC50126